MEARKGPIKKAPFLDRWECTDCESCIDLCPQIFKKNAQTGCIEVAELGEYPEEAIQEVIALCPGRCIRWQGS